MINVCVSLGGGGGGFLQALGADVNQARKVINGLKASIQRCTKQKNEFVMCSIILYYFVLLSDSICILYQRPLNKQ